MLIADKAVHDSHCIRVDTPGMSSGRASEAQRGYARFALQGSMSLLHGSSSRLCDRSRTTHGDSSLISFAHVP